MTPSIQTWQQTLPHGITLSCRACGEPGRPVLMFLHGFPEAAFVWDGLLQHFARPENGGYRCVAPNLRGYEKSSAPADVKAYRAKFLVQDIVALIDAECGAGQPLAALIAHDWGGAWPGTWPTSTPIACANWPSSTRRTPDHFGGPCKTTRPSKRPAPT